MSAQHADDVRSLMARLRQDHGYSRFYLIGHSAGSVSSRWLAKNLGNEIAGSIHSAAINADRRPGAPWASVMDFPYKSIVAPVLHLHHESDGCSYTQHGVTRSYAGGRLTTVRGGTVKTTDPCALHHHSYEGAEEAASLAVINWIKTGKVEPFVGE
jgi:poly(3-hydroxybutyrate) depolymerase